MSALVADAELGKAFRAALVRQFAEVRILVMGDPMLDYFHFGHVDRISPEAPVPVFIEDKTDLRDGGAGNVVANLVGLGCRVQTAFPPAPHTIKHRWFVGSHPVFRMDRDKDHSLCKGPDTWNLKGYHAVVISDYAKGYCSPTRCQSLIDAALRAELPIIVDPKGTDWRKYRGATAICPNEREASIAWQGLDIAYCVNKLGARGIRVDHARKAETEYYEARAKRVFDVTGAGDTVVAVIAAALACRCEIGVAAHIANIAAGLVVGQVGTFPCSASMLIEELER